MKKRIFLLLLLLLSLLVGCGRRDLNYIIQTAPHIQGFTTEICEDGILVETPEGDEYAVSLDVQYKDSSTQFSVGDEVVVYYDGAAAETFPMQIPNPYAIFLLTPANRETQ